MGATSTKPEKAPGSSGSHMSASIGDDPAADGHDDAVHKAHARRVGQVAPAVREPREGTQDGHDPDDGLAGGGRGIGLHRRRAGNRNRFCGAAGALSSRLGGLD